MPDRTRTYLVIGVVLVLWGLITHGTFAGTGDEAHYQMITYSIAFDRDIDLADDYDDESNLVFDGGLDAGPHARPGRGGALRPVHDIGMPMVFAPYFAVAYRLAELAAARVPQRWLDRARLNGSLVLRHLLSFGMIAITAWMAARLFDVFTGLSDQPIRAALWAALVMLSPPILSHSFLFFTEILTAALVLWVLLRLRRSTLSGADVVLAGAATGYLLLIHARNIGLCAGLIAIGTARFWGRSERAHVWRFLTAAAVMLLVRSAVTFYFWGTWLTSPHARLDTTGGQGDRVFEPALRLFGLLFDQSHGLLPVAPVFLLLPLGLLRLWRRDRVFATQIAVISAAYLIPVITPLFNPHGWRGGWSPAGRFLVPLVPLFGVLVFSAVARARGAPVWVMAIVVVQIAIDAIVWQQPKLLWNDGEKPQASALYGFLDGGSGTLTSRLPLLK